MLPKETPTTVGLVQLTFNLVDTGGAWRGLASGQRRERGRRQKTREAQIHIVFHMFNFDENFPDKEVTN